MGKTPDPNNTNISAGDIKKIADSLDKISSLLGSDDGSSKKSSSTATGRSSGGKKNSAVGQLKTDFKNFSGSVTKFSGLVNSFSKEVQKFGDIIQNELKKSEEYRLLY
jgi:hypothetical protein